MDNLHVHLGGSQVHPPSPSLPAAGYRDVSAGAAPQLQPEFGPTTPSIGG